MFQPIEYFTDSWCTNRDTPLIHYQQKNLNILSTPTLTSNENKLKITPHKHTYTTAFVLSDSPLKVSVVRLCSRSGLSTLCAFRPHTHTQKNLKAGRVNCDAITSSTDCLLLFKQFVFKCDIDGECRDGRESWGQTGDDRHRRVSLSEATQRCIPWSRMDGSEMDALERMWPLNLQKNSNTHTKTPSQNDLKSLLSKKDVQH